MMITWLVLHVGFALGGGRHSDFDTGPTLLKSDDVEVMSRVASAVVSLSFNECSGNVPPPILSEVAAAVQFTLLDQNKIRRECYRLGRSIKLSKRFEILNCKDYVEYDGLPGIRLRRENARMILDKFFTRKEKEEERSALNTLLIPHPRHSLIRRNKALREQMRHSICPLHTKKLSRQCAINHNQLRSMAVFITPVWQYPIPEPINHQTWKYGCSQIDHKVAAVIISLSQHVAWREVLTDIGIASMVGERAYDDQMRELPWGEAPVKRTREKPSLAIRVVQWTPALMFLIFCRRFGLIYGLVASPFGFMIFLTIIQKVCGRVMPLLIL